MIRLARLALATVALACTLSCTRTATQIIVRLDADPTTLARTARVHVRVWSHEDDVRLDRVVRVQGEGADTRFPLTIPLVPRDNDASRAWRAHVEAFDEEGRKFNEVRAISTYVSDRIFEVRLRLEDACIDQLTCAEDQTCRRGECMDARVEPTSPDVPSGLGWHELSDTRLVSACDPSFGQCSAITAAWSGAATDTDGDRLLVWGGGTGEYRGNQVFAFELDTLTMRALDAPSPVGGTCDESLLGGRPSVRQTYDGLVYIPELRRMFVHAEGVWCGPPDESWLYDPETGAWEAVGAMSLGMYPHVASAYDRDRGVLLVTPDTLWTYDPVARGYTLLPGAPPGSFAVTATIDTERRVLAVLGTGDYWELDLATGLFSEPPLVGCDAALAVDAPGFVFDPIGRRFVIWAGGDDIVLLDPETHACTVQSFPGGPGPALTQGTYGRFAYFPRHDVFVLVNRADQNVFALRLR